jgi:hypothetical protein
MKNEKETWNGLLPVWYQYKSVTLFARSGH